MRNVARSCEWLWDHFLTRPGRLILVGVFVEGAGFLIRDYVFGPVGIGVVVAGKLMTYLGPMWFLLVRPRTVDDRLSVVVRRFLSQDKKPPLTALDGSSAIAGTAVFLLSFVLPSLLVALASGGNSSAIAAAWAAANDGGGAAATGWLIVQEDLVHAVLVVLFLLPLALRQRLPWNDASDLARRILPAWLAVLASLLTCAYVLAMHPGRGPLASTAVAAVAVGGLGAAALLAPLYRAMTRAFWSRGITGVINPLRWQRAWAQIRLEFRRRPNPWVMPQAEDPEEGSGNEAGTGPQDAPADQASSGPLEASAWPNTTSASRPRW